MHLLPTTDQAPQNAGLQNIHIHIFRSSRSAYFIYSKKSSINWDTFLENGFICASMIRLVEVSRDPYGIERVVRDISR